VWTEEAKSDLERSCLTAKIVCSTNERKGNYGDDELRMVLEFYLDFNITGIRVATGTSSGDILRYVFTICGML
jgi:hypothetical protein